MRTTLVALLVCAAGCNQIFGIDKTNPQPPADAQPIDGSLVTLSLTWQLLTGHDGNATVTFPAIDGVMVQVGAFDGTLQTVPVDAEGNFRILEELIAHPYRIVYAIPGDPVPHEVQWQGGDGSHLVVPVWGRLPHVAPPASKYFVFHVTNPPAAFTGTNRATVFTAGQWSTGQTFATSAKVTYPYSQNMVALGGAPATPDAANADEEVLVQFDAAGNYATGFARMSADLTDLTSLGTNVNWQVPTQDSIGYAPTMDPQSRILSILNGDPLAAAHSSAGVVPSLSMPVMTEMNAAGIPGTGALLELASYSGQTSPLKFVNPFAAPSVTAPMPDVIEERIVRERALGSLPLDSGFAEIGTQGASAFAFGVGIADAPSFAGTQLYQLASEPVSVHAMAHSFADLSFAVNGGTRTSDCTVTLFQVTTMLMPVRTFLVLPGTPTLVHVPTDLLQDGGEYVFAIACTDQHASTTDFSQLASFPRTTSQLVPAAFTVTLQ